MTRIRLHPRQFTLVYILVLAIVSLPLAHSDTWAQNSGNNRPNPTSTPKPNTTPPPTKVQSRRAIGRLRGLGTREECHDVDKPLTAIVGPIPTEADLTEAKTTETLPPATIADYPTLWFYIPYSPDRLSAEFTLLDEKENDVYKTTFPLKEKPGIIGLKLPETLRPLQAGKRYKWVLSVICNPNNRTADISVYGDIDRISLDSALQVQLKKMSDPNAQSALYAENELWPEALTTLAQARRRNLQDRTLQADWSNLLKSMNLDDIASEPLTSCCKVEEPK
jgi:hypothetical protein